MTKAQTAGYYLSAVARTYVVAVTDPVCCPGRDHRPGPGQLPRSRSTDPISCAARRRQPRSQSPTRSAAPVAVTDPVCCPGRGHRPGPGQLPRSRSTDPISCAARRRQPRSRSTDPVSCPGRGHRPGLLPQSRSPTRSAATGRGLPTPSRSPTRSAAPVAVTDPFAVYRTGSSRGHAIHPRAQPYRPTRLHEPASW
jgi:hypothetical protein